jgi:RNA polymerase sigma-70 factor (ECF subfamily)
MSTGAVMDRARAGDEAALRALYEEHRGPVMRLALAILGDENEAEDVMQDVLVYARTHLDRYDARRGALGTWLHMLAVRITATIDAARARRAAGRGHPDGG